MDEVLVEQRGHTTRITLNRPEAMNAINGALGQGLSEALAAFRDDDDAWVAIITGAGERAFCAGADLKEMSQSANGTGRDPFWSAERPSLLRGLRVWKPIIAAINGVALGGGMEIALACDIRLAAETARLGQPEVQRGIMPMGGATQRLPRLVSLGVALQLMLTGELLDAASALRLGIVNAVVPAAELLPAAEKLAAQICANAPLAVRATKEAVYRGLDLPLDDGLRLENMLSRIVRNSEDAREGPRAFAEKRTASYAGR